MHQAQFPVRLQCPRAERLRALGMVGAVAAPAPSVEALRRARASQRRMALGADLADTVAARTHVSRDAQRMAWAPLLCVPAVATAGAVAADRIFLGVSLALLCVVAWLLQHARRDADPVLAYAAAFDTLVAAYATRLPETAAAELREIKTRLASLLPALHEHALANMDDAHVVRQAAVRYVPDALTLWSALGAPSATDNRVLHAQLALVRGSLDAIARRLDQAHGANLARHLVFVERRLDR